MITLTLAQAKSILKYSGLLYLGPMFLVYYLPVLWPLAFVLSLLIMWRRDDFAQRVHESEVSASYENQEDIHTVTSATSDLQIGFHGSTHDCDDED